ncbi:MAG: glycosyltransferase family 2 protein, partial [bacterium]
MTELPGILLTFIFWISFFSLFHTYFLYKHILRILAFFFSKNWRRDTSLRPSLTIIIPAYNEEKVIRRKLENCLALDYPPHKLEIILGSDASDDKTVEIAREFKTVKVHDFRERSGKTGIINKVMRHASGEIVVLTDANTMFNKDAVKQIVSLYADSRIGAVCGQVKAIAPDSRRELEKEVFYREFESSLKLLEGRLGCTVGAFGGFYSLRRALYEPLPPNAYSNDDFITAMRVLEKNYAVVFDPMAISTEETGAGIGEEFKRRIR